MPLTFHHKPSLVAYVTCGDPDLETSREVILAAIRAGADIIELGVPFSDPVADGPVIQRASERALKHGTSLRQVLELAREVRVQQPRAGLLIFSYLNPLVRMGLEKFAQTAKDAGVDGILATDLPVEEAVDYLPVMRTANLDTVFLAAPTSPDERLKTICEASRGFVYAVSRTGVTGTRQELAADASGLVRRIKQFTTLPVAVGFGISNAQQFAQVTSFTDAAVVGSGIVQVIEKSGCNAPQAVYDFITSLLHSDRQTTQSVTK
ncbi:MAG TPA: tryptophan synthase subunit alpha [Terriglobales bacterium]|nr:tryptophan synthase subunit alpha [Terriglobales bacterium]